MLEATNRARLTLEEATAVIETKERRKSQRVFLVLPVVLEWVTESGQQVAVHAETEQLSANGALLRFHPPCQIPSRIHLHCLATGQWTRAEAVWIDDPAPDGSTRLGVALHDPPENFWGLSFPE